MLSPVVEKGISFGDGYRSTDKNRDGFRPGLLEHIFWRVMDQYNLNAELRGLEVIDREEANTMRREVFAHTARDRNPLDSFFYAMNNIVGPRVQPGLDTAAAQSARSTSGRRYSLFQKVPSRDGVPEWFVDYVDTQSGRRVMSQASSFSKDYSMSERNRLVAEHVFFRVIDDYNSHVPEGQSSMLIKQSEATRLHDEVFLANASGVMAWDNFCQRLNRIVGPRVGHGEGNPLFTEGVKANGEPSYLARGTRLGDYYVDFMSTCVSTTPSDWSSQNKEFDAYATPAMSGLLLSPYDERVRTRNMFAQPDVGTQEVFLDAAYGIRSTSVLGKEVNNALDMQTAMAAQVVVRSRNPRDIDEFLPVQGERRNVTPHALLTVDDVSGLSDLRRWISADEYEAVAPGVRRSWQAFIDEINAPGYDFTKLGYVDGTRTSKTGLVISDRFDGDSKNDPASRLTPDKARENYFEHVSIVNSRMSAICGALRNNGFEYSVEGRSSARGSMDEIVAKIDDFNVDVRLLDRPLDINFVGRTYDRNSGTSRYVIVEQGTTSKDRRDEGDEFSQERSIRDGFWVSDNLFVTNVLYSLGVPQYVERDRAAASLQLSQLTERDLLVGHYADGYITAPHWSKGGVHYDSQEISRSDSAIRGMDGAEIEELRPEESAAAKQLRERAQTPVRRDSSAFARKSNKNATTNLSTWTSHVMLGSGQFVNSDRPNEKYMIRIAQETTNELNRENFFMKPHDGYSYRWIATAVSSARKRFAEDIDIEGVWRLAQSAALEYEAHLLDPEVGNREKIKHPYPDYKEFMPTEILAVSRGVTDEVGDLRASYFKFMVDSILYMDSRENAELGAYIKGPNHSLQTVVGHNDPGVDEVAVVDKTASEELWSGELLDATQADVLAYVQNHFSHTRDILVGTVKDREGREVTYERPSFRGDFVRSVEGVEGAQTFSANYGELKAINGVELTDEQRAEISSHDEAVRRQEEFGDDVISYDATNVCHFMEGRQFGRNRVDLINAIKCLEEGSRGPSEFYPNGTLAHVDYVQPVEDTNNFTPNRRFADATLKFGQRTAINLRTGEPTDTNFVRTYSDIARSLEDLKARGVTPVPARLYLKDVFDTVREGIESSMCEVAMVQAEDGKYYPDISVDHNGVVRYVARRRFDQGTKDAEFRDGSTDKGSWFSGEIGQIFTQRRNSTLIETRFLGSDNFFMAPGMLGYIVDQIDNEGTFEDRVRVLAFDEVMRRHIRKQIREDLSLPNITAGVGDAASLNRVYRNFQEAERISRDARDMSRLQGVPEEDLDAIEQTYGNMITFMGSFDEDANVNTERRREALPYYRQTYDMTSDAYDLAGRSLAFSPESERGLFDNTILGSAKKQSGKRCLVSGAKVDTRTGKIERSTPDDVAPVIARPMFQYSKFDAWNRKAMADSNFRHMLSYTTVPVGTAFVTGGGFTEEDDIPVSKEFVMANMVLNGEARNAKDFKPGDYVSIDSDGTVHAIDRSEIDAFRAMTRGDKMSDAHGNKGVIGIVIDRDVSDEEMAQMNPILRRLHELYKANPGDPENGVPRLDVLMSPHSALSRMNAGTAREAMSLGAWDLQGPGYGETRTDIHGNEYVTGAGGLTLMHFIIHDKTADTKTALVNGRGRNIGWQLSTVLDALGMNNVSDMAYSNNEKGARTVREMLRTSLGLDFDADSTLSPTLLQRSDDEVRVFDAVSMDRYPSNRRDDSVDVEFSQWAGSGGGYVELPFKLTWPERNFGNGDVYEPVFADLAANPDSLIEARSRGIRNGKERIDYVLKAHDIPSTGMGTWHMPVMSSQERCGSISVDGKLVNHDYTQHYSEIVKNAARWYDADEKWREAQAKADDIRARLDMMDPKASGQENAYETLQTELSKAEAAATQQMRRREHAERSAQMKFEQLANDVYDNRLSGRSNCYKLSMECAPVKGDAYTAIWSADPTLDFHTLGIGSELAKKLKVKDGDVVGMWRDPTLEMSNLLSFRVKVLDDTFGGKAYGVTINPQLAKPIAGDFDGDTVGVVAPHDKETCEELLNKACIERELVNPRTEAHEVVVGNSTEMKCAYAHHPELKERYDALVRQAQEIYANGDCRDADDPYTLDIESLRYDWQQMFSGGEYDSSTIANMVDVLVDMGGEYPEHKESITNLIDTLSDASAVGLDDALAGLGQLRSFMKGNPMSAESMESAAASIFRYSSDRGANEAGPSGLKDAGERLSNVMRALANDEAGLEVMRVCNAIERTFHRRDMARGAYNDSLVTEAVEAAERICERHPEHELAREFCDSLSSYRDGMRAMESEEGFDGYAGLISVSRSADRQLGGDVIREEMKNVRFSAAGEYNRIDFALKRETDGYVAEMRPIVDQLYDLTTEAYAAEVGENALSFSSVQDYVASVQRACIDTKAKGNLDALHQYCKYLGAYSDSPDEEQCATKVDANGVEYLDVTTLHDYRNPETGEIEPLVTPEYDENTQNAVDIKSVTTATAGTAMQKFLRGIPERPDLALEASKQIYQMVLDAKRDGQRAKKNVAVMDPFSTFIEQGVAYKNLGEGTLEPDKWVIDRKKGPMRAPEFAKLFHDMHASVGMDNFNKEDIRALSEMLVDPETGYVMGLKERGARVTSPNRVASFSNNSVPVVAAALTGGRLLNDYDIDLYGPKSMRYAYRGTTRSGEEFVPGTPYVAKSVVYESAQEAEPVKAPVAVMERTETKQVSVDEFLGDSPFEVKAPVAAEPATAEPVATKIETPFVGMAAEPVYDEAATVAYGQLSFDFGFNDEAVLQDVFDAAGKNPGACVHVSEMASADVVEPHDEIDGKPAQAGVTEYEGVDVPESDRDEGPR